MTTLTMLHDLFVFLKHFYTTELGRIVATGALFAMGLAANRIWGHYLLRSRGTGNADRHREKLVYAKNIVWVVVGLAIIGIWASKIAGIVLSLAAVAGAMLIVSKELLMCLLGYGYLTVSRSFRLGDFVDIGTYQGRVIDIDAVTTTLAETGLAHQLTGKTLVLPNSMLLTQAVRNASATGTYIVDLLPIVVPYDVDFELAERCALEAAQAVTESWQSQAEAHLAHIEGVAFVDLPSSRPKVLWQSSDAKAHTLVIRFGCPMMQRVSAEQDIFRKFWLLYRNAQR